MNQQKVIIFYGDTGQETVCNRTYYMTGATDYGWVSGCLK